MENKFLKLTNAVYKVLEFFPESDPLKNRAKDKALAIMEHLVLINETSGWASFQKEKIKVQVFEDIDILMGYLWIGKTQGWLNSVNCLIISNEYEKIKKEIAPIIELKIELTQKLPGIEKSSSSTQITPNPVLDNTRVNNPSFDISDRQSPPSHEVTARQRKILEFLSKNEKAQVMDLQTIFSDITKRTIRRDLDELLEAGKIIRLGDFNQVFYKIKG
jgi:DNA-binding transcriptional ArsR family regulator